MLPFTREQFVSVFADYNVGVWPAQILAYLLGLSMVILLLRQSRNSDRIIGGGLAAMWVWTGAVYHWLYFSPINSAALIFGALFIMQGAAFFLAAVVRDDLRFGLSAAPTAWLGWAFVLYAAILYPLLGLWAGDEYPKMPIFGITPCPVTIFSFGLLLLTSAPVPRWIFVIPLVWSLIGGSAAFLLSIPQDWSLLISGIAIPLIVFRDRSRPRGVGAR